MCLVLACERELLCRECVACRLSCVVSRVLCDVIGGVRAKNALEFTVAYLCFTLIGSASRMLLSGV